VGAGLIDGFQYPLLGTTVWQSRGTPSEARTNSSNALFSVKACADEFGQVCRYRIRDSFGRNGGCAS
jgi:hypothetical protein